jgi:hypothetical protein
MMASRPRCLTTGRRGFFLVDPLPMPTRGSVRPHCWPGAPAAHTRAAQRKSVQREEGSNPDDGLESIK